MKNSGFEGVLKDVARDGNAEGLSESAGKCEHCGCEREVVVGLWGLESEGESRI